MNDDKKLYDINYEVMKYCRSLLREQNDSKAMKFLKESGLTDDIIEQFDLGYSGEDGNGIIIHLKSLGYSEDEIISAGIEESADLFQERVLFPVKNEDGTLSGFVGRALQGDCPAFMQTGSISPIFENGKKLFGIDHAQKSKADYYILCEGCIDTLMINQAGFDMAINSLVCSSYEEFNLDLNRSVLLAFDSDKYGKESCDKARMTLLAAGHKIGIIDVSPYRDPAEYIKMAGAEAFAEKVAKARSSLT